MADTFSNDLRLRLQESGSNAGTWGDLLNGTITNIASGFGQGSEAIPNASTHTITLADGTADEARSLYLKCTGGGQACTVTLGPNTISKVWIIDNATSYTLTFSQGSGANVAIAAGAVKVIATDGAGSGAAVVDTLDGLEGSMSTLAVTGNITIGNAAANTNVGLVLNGVASKAQRIAFNEGATNRWLLGQGAASETSAFELYNAGGVVALSVDRTTNATTFAAGAVFNEGSYDSDFRVESNGNPHMLVVDGGSNVVSIGTSTKSATVTIESGGNTYASGSLALKGSGISATNYITNAGGNFYISYDGTTDDFVLSAAGLIINEDGADRDFRVESNSNANMLFVDAGGDGVGIGTNVAGNSALEVRSTGVDGTFANAIGFQYSGNSNEANAISTSVSSNAGQSGFKFNVSDGGGSSGKTNVATFLRNQIIFNDASNDQDFRVESDTNAHALFLDADNDVLLLGYSNRNGAFVDRSATGFQIGTPGVDDNGGQIFMTQNAAQNAWKSILSCHDANATGALIFLHAVRTADQNRSGAMIIRYAYNQAFTIMTQSLQNMVVELRVSSNVLQYRITTGGPYTVSLQIMANG